jgi:hypothetical protein
MKKWSLLPLILFGTLCVFAENNSSEEEESNVTIKGSGSIMFGQIAKGHSHGKASDWPLDHHWQSFYAGRIDAISKPKDCDWFTAKIGLEIGSAFPVLRETNIMKDIFKTQQRPFLPQAVGIFDFDINNISCLIESGMMEYTFNPDVKNLGNYMYRSTAYPLNLRTKLDYIYSNLMGIRAQAGFINNQVKVGMIMNSIIDAPPFFDMNLGFYASYTNGNKLIDAAFGLVFERVIAIDDSITDCKKLKNRLGDSTATMRGTKIIGRATFDIKQLLGNNSIFGPNDAKIYAEGAILGLKDPDFYNYQANPIYPKTSLLNRIPLMLGINIPTFKILDHLSVELEYCNYPYPFDWWGSLNSPSPKPDFPSGSTLKDTTWRDIYLHKDNLKWTFYLKKSISNFDIIAMAANDHILYETYQAESHTFTEHSLRGEKNWHWYIKLQCRL